MVFLTNSECPRVDCVCASRRKKNGKSFLFVATLVTGAGCIAKGFAKERSTFVSCASPRSTGETFKAVTKKEKSAELFISKLC